MLAHLRWAIKPENATVTAECLELLGQELRSLKQAEADGGLLAQVHTAACTCPLLPCFAITNPMLVPSVLAIVTATSNAYSQHGPLTKEMQLTGATSGCVLAW